MIKAINSLRTKRTPEGNISIRGRDKVDFVNSNLQTSINNLTNKNTHT